jgi:hypothetical protein
MSGKSKWRIIWTVTLFNLLFEYSLRGLNDLRLHPALPLLLFLVYFTLFTMAEDLIVRFKLRAGDLMVLAFFYGTVYDALLSGSLFFPPLVWGVNWRNLIFTNIFWWGLLQTVLAFYFANRLVRRDWSHPKLSKWGWGLCLVANLFVIAVFQRSGLVPWGTKQGREVVVLVVMGSFFLFVGRLRRRRLSEAALFVRSKFLDLLCLLTLLLFVFSGVFLTQKHVVLGTSYVNLPALVLVKFWTIILGVILLIYWLRRGDISV